MTRGAQSRFYVERGPNERYKSIILSNFKDRQCGNAFDRLLCLVTLTLWLIFFYLRSNRPARSYLASIWPTLGWFSRASNLVTPPSNWNYNAFCLLYIIYDETKNTRAHTRASGWETLVCPMMWYDCGLCASERPDCKRRKMLQSYDDT